MIKIKLILHKINFFDFLNNLIKKYILYKLKRNLNINNK